MGYRTTKSKIKVENNKTNNHTEFYYRFFRNILIISIPLVIISTIILSSLHSSARISSSDSLAISVPSSCTLSSSVDETHSASIVNSTYENNIGRTTLTTFCNDKNGYSVYAIGDSLNNEGNNTLVGSNGSNINSGTATSGDTSNWAMKLSLKAGDTSTTPPTIIPPFDNYATVPTTWTKVATIPSSTTDMKEGSNFTTTYATYISPTQAAGTYLGQVKYLLTHPSATEPGFNNLIMQEVANWKNDLAEEESVQAIDIRDGKVYWVTKLKDGHIWMTQNLDYDIEANTTLNSQTTDLNECNVSGQYAEYNDGYNCNITDNVINWTPTSSATTISFQGTIITNWQNDGIHPYSASKTDDENTGYASLGNYYNWTAAIASNNSASLNQNTLNDITKNPQNSICPKGWRLPTVSSQPANIIGSTNEFARLNYVYNNNYTNTDIGLIVPPLRFNLAGYIYSTLTSLTSIGRYSSSSVAGSGELYHLSFTSNSVETSRKGGSTRGVGQSIRCVAR